MSAHTPGPWFAERHGIVTADVGGHRRQVASTTGDAVMHGDASVSVVEIQMANARLAAAAPDLLAACLASVSRCTFNCTPESHCGRCEPLLAAISKASGNAP